MLRKTRNILNTNFAKFINCDLLGCINKQSIEHKLKQLVCQPAFEEHRSKKLFAVQPQ